MSALAYSTLNLSQWRNTNIRKVWSLILDIVKSLVAEQLASEIVLQ